MSLVRELQRSENNSFIRCNIDTLYPLPNPKASSFLDAQSRASYILDAQYLFCAEDHANTRGYSCRTDHAELIDATVIPCSILLVEGFKAMVEVTGIDREAIFKALRISKYAQSQITVVGWDAYNNVSQQTEPVFLCRNHEDGTSSVSSEKHRAPLIREALSDLRETCLKEEKAWEDSNIPEEMQEQMQGQIVKIYSQARHVYKEALADEFPERTAAMVYTIERIEQQRQQGIITGKIYLIGGALHLNEASKDPRLSLKPLYDRLATLPAAIVSSKKTDYSCFFNDK